MRAINTQDVFKLARIIKTVDISEMVGNMIVEGKKKNADAEAIGMKVFMSVFSACGDSKAESQIYDLIAGITEKTPDDIKNQTLDSTISDLKTIVEENDIKSFFNTASRLTIK